jgi:hypothetical protein
MRSIRVEHLDFNDRVPVFCPNVNDTEIRSFNLRVNIERTGHKYRSYGDNNQ